MLGGDGNDDFPIVNTNSRSKLAKLFEAEPEEDVSLKYTPPKETKMKPPMSAVQLRVLMGKTVEAFKMESDRWKVFGKVGAAVLGNEEQGHFQLYVYRNDERKVTSVDITSTFKFSIHENNYAIFHDRVGDPWSLHFEKSTDLADFSRQIILAKWRSSDCKSKKLIQDIVYGEKGKIVGNEDQVVVTYRITPMSNDKQLCPELPKRTLTSNADEDLWEVSLVGTLENSCRVIILSHDNLGDWRAVVPKGCSLMLEMEIQQITSQVSNENLEHPTNTLHNLVNRKLPREKVADPASKQSLVARMAKMGQSVVPFPNFPSTVESVTANNEIDDNLKLPNVMIEAASSHLKEPEIQPVSKKDCKMPDERSNLLLRQSMEGDLHGYSRDLISVTSQFNVLFSEMRTSNAELRMNLTRISDRVDTVVHKVDVSTESTNNKLDTVQKQLDKIMDNNNKMHTQIIENLELLSGFVERNAPPVILKKDLVSDSEMLELKKRNSELEECLQAANAASEALQVKVQELNNHIEINEKQKELMQQLQESEKKGDHQCPNCKCHVDDRMKSLEMCVETLETRNNDLEMAKIELENKVANLDSKLSEIILLKKEAEVVLNEVKSEYERKILFLENDLHKIKSEYDAIYTRLTTEADKELNGLNQSKPDVTEVVKKLMNMTYRSLKLQLTKDDSDLTKPLQESLAYTLRMVTNNYLAQYGDAGKNASVDSGSPKDLATNPSLNKSLGSDHLLHTSSDSSASPRSKSEALSSGSESEMGNPKSFSPNIPLPPTPDIVSATDKPVTSDLKSSDHGSDKLVSCDQTEASESVDSDYSVTPSYDKTFTISLAVDDLSLKSSQMTSSTETSQSSVPLSYKSDDTESLSQLPTNISCDLNSEISTNIDSPTPVDNSQVLTKVNSSSFTSSGINPDIDKLGASQNRSDFPFQKPSVPSKPFLNKNVNNLEPKGAVLPNVTVDANNKSSECSGAHHQKEMCIESENQTNFTLTSEVKCVSESGGVQIITNEPVEHEINTRNESISCLKNKSISGNLEANTIQNTIENSHDGKKSNSGTRNDSTPYVFAPLISSEPPPFTITPSPSPPNSPSPGNLLSNISALKDDKKLQQHIREHEDSEDVWRPQPPPLFDDDDEDDGNGWMIS